MAQIGTARSTPTKLGPIINDVNLRLIQLQQHSGGTITLSDSDLPVILRNSSAISALSVQNGAGRDIAYAAIGGTNSGSISAGDNMRLERLSIYIYKPFVCCPSSVSRRAA